MKKTLAIYTLFTVSLLFSTVCMAVENPNVSRSFNAADAATTVPSQGQRQQLLTQPNSLSAGSSNAVTGNVGGLRYFHGVVPYGSQYYSSANLSDSGTGAVTSFLRRSTDSILSDRNPGQTRSYYDPRQAVSSFYVQNGQRTALSQSVGSGQIHKSSDILSTLPKTISAENLQRPLSTNNQELDQILSRQIALREKAKESFPENLPEDDHKFKNFFEIEQEPEEIETPQTEDPLQDILQDPLQKPEIEKEQTLLKELKIEMLEEPSQEEKKPEEPVSEYASIYENLLKEKNKDEQTEGEQPDVSEDASPSQEISDRIERHAEAERIRGKHKTFESLANAKFSDYMRTAEEFIRAGKFYKAADAYSLAAVWMPDDPRSYMGQSFALFAAGEYMSSAYYLGRAIEIDPALAGKKYDLAGLIDDRDVFENRMIEMTTWQDRSGSGELAFLTAYIYYQDEKLARAATAIGKAEEKMPGSAAVAILKNVIIPEKRTGP